MSNEERVQSVRNAWTNALRAEVLRVGRTVPEVARVAVVGMWIATYADADGSNAFPGRDTLATLCGCSQETVTRAVKVLTGVGLLVRKRRPNASSVYQLLIPTGRLDWASHIHHYTDTRQRKAHAKKKAEQAAEITAHLEAERTASMDAFRTASTDGVPDSVHGGGSEPEFEAPDSVHGRPRKASMDAVRTASMAGVYQYPPTSGRDPHLHHDMAGLSPKPQTPAREAGKDDESSKGESPEPTVPAEPPATAPAFARCTNCSIPLLRPGRTTCQACTPATERNAS
ncbi:helix-turn-helix domain-containing protein [Streptomyces sp. NPDC002547]